MLPTGTPEKCEILQGLRMSLSGLAGICTLPAVSNAATMNQRQASTGPANAIYGLGFIGALIYYLSTATGFWMGVLGVLKAIVWPAFLVYEALVQLGA